MNQYRIDNKSVISYIIIYHMTQYYIVSYVFYTYHMKQFRIKSLDAI